MTRNIVRACGISMVRAIDYHAGGRARYAKGGTIKSTRAAFLQPPFFYFWIAAYKPAKNFAMLGKYGSGMPDLTRKQNSWYHIPNF